SSFPVMNALVHERNGRRQPFRASCGRSAVRSPCGASGCALVLADIGHGAMLGTVGTSRHRILAAEAEACVARVAERPQAVLDLAATPRERRDRNLCGPRGPVGENAFAADLLVRHGAAESTRLHRPVDRPIAPARPIAG